LARHRAGVIRPGAATAPLALPQGDQRIYLEPHGSRRLSSQTLVDVRLSTPIAVDGATRVELLLDVLNVLNETLRRVLPPTICSARISANPPRSLIRAERCWV
jgi:hypothetical protein